MSKDFSYTIVDDFDKVFDEKGNTFLAVRKLVWGDTDPEKAKLDIRKWYVNAAGEETVGKGVSFLTEEGPNALVRVLTESGFGHTREILENIKDRDDFKPALNIVLGKDSEFYDESANEDLYVPGNDLFDYD